MSKGTALTISIVIGFVILGIIGGIVLIMFPFEQVFAPTPTITLTPTVTSTPTFPVYLPTASLVTPTKEPPTPTNTMVPTSTSAATKTATPTRLLPTDTPVIPPTAIVPAVTSPITSTLTLTATLEPTSTPTQAPRQYTYSFIADDTTSNLGQCTHLRWQSAGPITLRLDGNSVDPSGEREVCPRGTTTYVLEFQVSGSAQVQSQRITIRVE